MRDNELRLRAPEPEDLEVMYQMENDPSMWSVSCTTVPYSRFMLRQYIEQATGDIFTDNQVRLMAECVDSGEVVGCADLTNYEPLHGRAEIGLAISPAFQGKGIGGQVLNLLCRYAFDFLHLHQLVAYIPADNEACLRMFAREGFASQLRLREWLQGENGEYKDAVLIQCFNEK